MNKLLLLISFSLVALFSFGQKPGANAVPGRTHFIAELGGPGILFSANIDTRFAKSTLGWGGRIGLGFVTADEYDGNFNYELRSVVTVPVQINYVFGKSDSPNTLEVGAGATYVGRKLEIFNFYDDKTTNLFGTVSFMYRRQPLKGGFTWRAGFTPLIAKGYIQPSGAVSVGYSF
ncbi:MAG TPA: hypothetical protein VFV31_00725 [Chitinophagaceae bacterium]|nr:hypothetical protein [Chitinophagaceae bacterium]